MRASAQRHLSHVVRLALVVATTSWVTACASVPVDPIRIEAVQTAARVKSALVNDARVGTRAIEVGVAGGVVRLSGVVASNEEAAHAVAVAQAVPGVTRVESSLQVGRPEPDEDAADADTRAAGLPVRGIDLEFREVEVRYDLLALGGAVRIVDPRGVNQGTRWQVSPIVRFGNRRGLGPAIAFDWYTAEPRATDRVAGDVGRVRIRPFMAGLRYTVPMGRWSLAPSLVAGVAVNGLALAEAGSVDRLAVGVGNSAAWRSAVSLWYESSRRTALHASLGRVITRPRYTVVEDGVLRDRRANADATILLVGVAYKVF